MVDAVRIPSSRTFLTRAALAVVVTALVCTVVPAQQGTIEDVITQGLMRMHRDSFLHALGVQIGEPYDEARLRQRFQALWKLGLFEDIVFDVEDGPKGGKVLIVKVKERPTVGAVVYEENSVVTRTAIEDRLKERNIKLSPGKPLDMGQVFYAETAIRDLLAEKGYLNAEVDAEIKITSETTRNVEFSITTGGKTRIRKIDFVGNTTFHDGKLKKQLQLTQERRWYWPWSGKNLYHPVKWDQDVANVRKLYLNSGYLDVEVRPPVLDVVSKDEKKRAEQGKPPQEQAAPEPAKEPSPPEPPPETLTPKQASKREKQERAEEKKEKKVKRTVYLTVPIVEGPQYTMGELQVSGNSVVPTAVIQGLIPLQTGQILRNDVLDAGIDRVTRVYEDRGHLYANVVRRIERREGEHVADVVVTVDEDKPYKVGSIEFAGNTSTRDAVLRRELLIREGSLFNRTALDVSRVKLNQLGYWQARDEPAIEPNDEEGRVDITFAGEEAGRNEIQVGGGYSGVDGAFFNGVYSTRNFLGRGQIVSLALQVGGRSSRYQLSFQEPWLFNKPYTFGFSIFSQNVDYGASLSSESTGFSVLVGKRLGRFSNLNLNYRYQDVTSTTVLFTTASSIRTQNTISSMTPVYRFSTVNNPYRPSRGRSFDLAFQVAGGPLGGDTSFIKPVTTWTSYNRTLGKSFLALHVQGGLIRELGSGSSLSGSNIQGVPRFERFWLGGDTLGPRVFETRSITPLRYLVLDAAGNIVDVIGDPRFISPSDLANTGGIPVLIEAGGDRFFLIQAEYVLPLNEQIELAAFFDVGDALFEDQSLGFDTARASTGLELRFHLPIFPVPLRLIYGIPVREFERDRTSNFTFSIGRSF
jgi:outer membrane protein insertion porin family